MAIPLSKEQADVVTEGKLIDRETHLSDFSKRCSFQLLEAGIYSYDGSLKAYDDRYMHSPYLRMFEQKEWEVDPNGYVSRLRYWKGQTKSLLGTDEFATYGYPISKTGFLTCKLRVRHKATIYLVFDEIDTRNPGEDLIEDSKEKGMAILATINAGYKTDLWNARLSANVIRNDSGWFNNAAQSPSFFAQRILNSDLDGNTVKYGVNSPLYSTFGALYSFNPKFSPVATSLGTNDAAFEDGQTESYNIANYNKNSWTTNVYTRSQLALMEMMLLDPALQMALPYGLATSNRFGGQGTVTAGFKDFVEVQGLVTVLSQVKPVIGFEAVKYMEYGGGAKADIFKAIGFSKPLEISGCEDVGCFRFRRTQERLH